MLSLKDTKKEQDLSAALVYRNEHEDVYYELLDLIPPIGRKFCELINVDIRDGKLKDFYEQRIPKYFSDKYDLGKLVDKELYIERLTEIINDAGYDGFEIKLQNVDFSNHKVFFIRLCI